MLRFGIAVTALCLTLGSAFAAPAGLLNKTVHVSFAMSVPNTGSDGKSVTTPRTYDMTLYVSSAGRVFYKGVQRHGNNYGRDIEAGPERTGASFQFSGSQLVGTAASGNAATRVTVTFDSGFQSCTVSVVSGGSGGRMVWKGLNGVTYTATGPATYSAQTCSVQSGNAFAR
jgi:hypothetical protein